MLYMDLKTQQKIIPKSKRPYIGFVLESGINTAMMDGATRLGMSKSSFVRYCITRTLQDLGLLSRCKKMEAGNG